MIGKMGFTTAFNGTKVVLTDERWKHIVLRHPELENKLSLVLDAVAIQTRYIRTAFYTSYRRYEQFKKLKPS